MADGTPRSYCALVKVGKNFLLEPRGADGVLLDGFPMGQSAVILEPQNDYFLKIGDDLFLLRAEKTGESIVWRSALDSWFIWDIESGGSAGPVEFCTIADLIKRRGFIREKTVVALDGAEKEFCFTSIASCFSSEAPVHEVALVEEDSEILLAPCYSPERSSDMDSINSTYGELTCPCCSLRFDRHEVLSIAVDPDLLGDPVLGPQTMLRFRPVTFDMLGHSIDPKGRQTNQTACPHCRRELNPVSMDLRAFRFSAFYPERAAPDEVGRIIAYCHLESASASVVSDAKSRLKLSPGTAIKAASKPASTHLPDGSRIKVTAEIPGLEFESAEGTISLWEDVQSLEFRFKPPSSTAGSVCRGAIHFWLSGFLLASVEIVIFVPSDEVPEIFRESLLQANARAYRSVFPSYSHHDDRIVELMEGYARAFGDEYLRDVRSLRSGQEWNPELMDFIKRADVFQLFWSTNASESPYVSQEWRRALAERSARPDPFFIRPVYWDVKPEAIPKELEFLHFAKLPL